MDTELDPSDVLESVESSFIPQSNAPVWSHPDHIGQKKKGHLWTPVLAEYYRIVDDPTNLPTILQPLFSKERAFTFGNRPPFYFNYPINVADEFGIHRRLYINLCQQNVLVGAFGATLVGIATRHFAISPTRVHTLLAQKLLMGQPVRALSKMALTTTLMTTTLGSKLAFRAISGGVIFDMIKRSLDDVNSNDHWINAGIAGGFCGLMYGFRGGLPQAWLAAGLCSAGAVLSEFIPPQDLTMKSWFGKGG